MFLNAVGQITRLAEQAKAGAETTVDIAKQTVESVSRLEAS